MDRFPVDAGPDVLAFQFADRESALAVGRDLAAAATAAATAATTSADDVETLADDMAALGYGRADVVAAIDRGARSHEDVVQDLFDGPARVAGPQKGASMSLQLESLAICGIRKSIHPTRT